MQKIYVCVCNTKRIDSSEYEWGISELGHIYNNKENAVKQIIEFGYRAVEGETEIFEKICKDGKFRHTYPCVNS